MSYLEKQFKDLDEHWEEWVKIIATYSYKALERRIGIIHKQQLIAEQQKNADAFELMLKWEYMTYEAFNYKNEFNTPDEHFSPEENRKHKQKEYEEELKNHPEPAHEPEVNEETLNTLNEERQQVFRKLKIKEDHSNQTSLF